MNARFASILMAICLLYSFASEARAQSLYAGVLGGYGSTTDKQNGVEPYGAGAGVSAGLTLPLLPIYLGARAVWYMGDSAQIRSAAGTVELDSRYSLYGVDLGYDLALGPITLRPGLGVGAAALNNSGTAAGVAVSTRANSLYLAPGVGLIITAGLLYVGAEMRLNYLTEDEHFNSVSMLASLGLTI